MALAIAGQNFVLVGSFSVYRYQVVDLIESQGGRVSELVDKNTNYVVYAKPEDRHNAKISYGERYGAKIINEGELEMLLIASGVGARKRAEQIQAAIQDNPDYGVW